MANAFVFFFQAEDGIRDDLVTGVQTCALPISRFMSSMNLVAQTFQYRCEPVRKILIQLNFHRMCGAAGTGRSSSAEAAANTIAARTSSTVQLGKSVRMSSTQSPLGKLDRTVPSVTRVPLNTGSPPQVALSRTMRS